MQGFLSFFILGIAAGMKSPSRLLRLIFPDHSGSPNICSTLSIFKEVEKMKGQKNMGEKSKARASFMKAMVLTNATTNFAANGACYYFLSGGVEKDAVGFCINGTITAFILSLICGAFAVMTVDGKCKKGEFPVDNYVWGEHMLVDHFPRKSRFGQVLYGSVLVTIEFLFVSAGIPVLLGCAGGTIPVVTGAVVHGIQAGCMALTINYYMMVARCCTYAAAQEKSF